MKKVVAIVLVLIMTLALSTAALAEEQKSATTGVALGAPNISSSDQVAGWAGDGHNDTAAPIPQAIFWAATGISIRISKDGDPEATVGIILTSDKVGGWWAQTDFVLKDVLKPNENGAGGVISIPFSKLKDGAAFATSTNGAAIQVGYWSDGIADLGLVSATLSGVPRALAEELDVPTTGVTTFIAIAALAVAASGTGAVVVSRKLKKQ